MGRQVAGCDLEIGPADRARSDAQDEIACGGLRLGQVYELERILTDRPRSLDDEGTHQRES
jgi:hypothetical protein